MGLVVSPALGVDVHEPHIGSTCGPGGLWHFVHNQIPEGTEAGTLTAEFSVSGVVVVGANKVLQSNQHYDIMAAGVLISASDDIEEGMLLLSHIVCDEETTTIPKTTNSSVASTTSVTEPPSTTVTSKPTTSSSVASTTSVTEPPKTTVTSQPTSTTKYDGEAGKKFWRATLEALGLG